MGFQTKPLILDARGHLLGRLAAIVAKTLLQGGLERLKAFEGVPPPYDKQKRLVVPSALRVLRLGQNRKYCDLNRLSHEVGWKYQKVISTLEARRKVKAAQFHARKCKVEAQSGNELFHTNAQTTPRRSFHPSTRGPPACIAVTQ
ncbi:hypothetical protein C0Q70_10954 [Pomacea canaliculata]|uniref:Uncharacterized protein n=1 Tax=Pomacea canaliculata TaxID=400727 RepID=A0A2T7P4L6_POMCA|nr:hypothetical protein C0Q70_10954 [Pomacea canaliculata]